MNKFQEKCCHFHTWSGTPTVYECHRRKTPNEPSFSPWFIYIPDTNHVSLEKFPTILGGHHSLRERVGIDGIAYLGTIFHFCPIARCWRWWKKLRRPETKTVKRNRRRWSRKSIFLDPSFHGTLFVWSTTTGNYYRDRRNLFSKRGFFSGDLGREGGSFTRNTGHTVGNRFPHDKYQVLIRKARWTLATVFLILARAMLFGAEMAESAWQKFMAPIKAGWRRASCLRRGVFFSLMEMDDLQTLVSGLCLIFQSECLAIDLSFQNINIEFDFKTLFDFRKGYRIVKC